MAVQKQDDQHEHTFSNYVRIRDAVRKTCLRWWTIGKSGERGSGISVLPAQLDDDDDDEFTMIPRSPSLKKGRIQPFVHLSFGFLFHTQREDLANPSSLKSTQRNFYCHKDTLYCIMKVNVHSPDEDTYSSILLLEFCKRKHTHQVCVNLPRWYA